VKGVDSFHKKASSASGYSSQCKACVNSRLKSKYWDDPERYRSIANKSANKNKDSVKARQKQYRDSHSETIYIRIKEWRKSNKPARNAEARRRRALIKGNGVSPYTEKQVLETYGSVCHICSEAIDLSAPRACGKQGWELGLHIDHVVPIAKGGEDALHNVKPAHGKCNLSKGSRLTFY
jgi:5-methylcytosine-specific restriction endonuclease McrA